MKRMPFVLLLLVCVRAFALSPNECRSALGENFDAASWQSCLEAHNEADVRGVNFQRLVAEFSKAHFGDFPDELKYWRWQSFVENNNYGQAVLDLEAIISADKKDIREYANIKSYLFRNPEFSKHLFRATEEEGVDYYACVFGVASAKLMLKKRLENFGGSLSFSVRDQRLQDIENLKAPTEILLDKDRDCSEQRVRFTAIWPQEIDAKYVLGEQSIRISQVRLLDQLKEDAQRSAEKAAAEARHAAERKKIIKNEGVAIRSRLHPYNLALSEVSVYEYGSSTGFRVSVLNLSSKRIKYLNFTVVGVNAVGDVVLDRLKGRRLRFRGIGPIEAGESASYSENIMWFTDVIDRARIEALTIEYMDGSVISVKSPMSLLLKGQDFDVLTLDLLTTR